jgi:hypothetical protein
MFGSRSELSLCGPTAPDQLHSAHWAYSRVAGRPTCGTGDRAWRLGQSHLRNMLQFAVAQRAAWDLLRLGGRSGEPCAWSVILKVLPPNPSRRPVELSAARGARLRTRSIRRPAAGSRGAAVVRSCRARRPASGVARRPRLGRDSLAARRLREGGPSAANCASAPPRPAGLCRPAVCQSCYSSRAADFYVPSGPRLQQSYLAPQLPPTADKAQQAQALASAIQRIRTLHHQDFPAVQKLVVPYPPRPDHAVILRRRMNDALERVSIFRRSTRKAAKAAAVLATQMECNNYRRRAKHSTWRFSKRLVSCGSGSGPMILMFSWQCSATPSKTAAHRRHHWVCGMQKFSWRC